MPIISSSEAQTKFKNHEAACALALQQSLERAFNEYAQYHDMKRLGGTKALGERFEIKLPFASSNVGAAESMACSAFQAALDEAGWNIQVGVDMRRSNYDETTFTFIIFRRPTK